MTFLIVLLWIMLVLMVFGVIGTVALIGKPRKPITPGVAIYTMIINAIWIAVIVSCITLLSR